MESQRTSRQFWELLNKNTLRELFIYSLLCAIFFLSTSVNPFNTEQPYNEEDRRSTAIEHLPLSKRLGYAILLNAGYINVELHNKDGAAISTNEQKTKEDTSLNFTINSQHDINLLSDINSNDIDIKKLTIAILAAEKYNRNFFEQKTELIIGKLFLKFFGFLPDFSYGIAQVRPSTAKKVFFEEMGLKKIPDSKIIYLLENNKHNIIIAEKYISILYTKNRYSSQNIDEKIKIIAKEYNGSNHKSISGLNYSEAVLGAYNILTFIDSSYEESDENQETESAIITQEINFDFDSLNYIADIDFENLKKNYLEMITIKNTQSNKNINNAYDSTKINLHYIPTYPENEAFVKTLQEKRICLIKKELTNIGFNSNNINISIEKLNKASKNNYTSERAIITVEVTVK